MMLLLGYVVMINVIGDLDGFFAISKIQQLLQSILQLSTAKVHKKLSITIVYSKFVKNLTNVIVHARLSIAIVMKKCLQL